MLLNCSSGSSKTNYKPCPPGEKGQPLQCAALLSTIYAFSLLRIFLPKDLRPDSGRETAWKSVLEVERRFPEGIPNLDPVKNMKITDDKFKELLEVSSQIIISDMQ